MLNSDKFIDKLISDLKDQEGFSSTPYRDSRGYWTVSFGLAETTSLCQEQIDILGTDKIKDVKWVTRKQGERLLELELMEIIEKVEKIDWICDLPVKKIPTVLNIIFNMGWNNFCKFENTIKALQDKNWTKAMTELMDSNYLSQVKGRCLKLAFELAGIDITIEEARKLYKILKERIK